ncbi:MAG: hypothetical protein ABEK75_02800 [Salinibacter sp.]
MSTNSLADALYERLRRSFPPDQAYAATDWTPDAMPGPVRHYLTHLLRHHHRQEERHLRRARTEWVRYDHPDMEQATRTYLDRMEDHLRVPQAQWTDTLRMATRRTTEYLVRPVPTLTAFVFEEASAAVPVDHVQWRMRFFGPYDYLRNAVEAFAEKRDRDAFEQDQVERILRRVDERMTADFDTDRWLRLLDPLFETAQHANGRKQIPLPVLRTFFEEKNAPRILDALPPHDREAAVSRHMLRDLLESTATESAPDPSEASTADSQPSDLRHASEGQERASDPTQSDSDEADDAATPMWKQFQVEQDPSQRRPAPKEEQTDDSQPLWTQFSTRKSPSGPEYDSTSSSSPTESTSAPEHSSESRSPSEPESGSGSESTPAEPSHDPTLTALEREVFGHEQTSNRSVYVRELFQGDGDAYRDVLERLRRTGTWSEASQIIASDVFRANQVNIYSDAAVHFTDAVEAGFKEA